MKPIIPGWHGMSASVWVCVCVRVCMRMRESLHKTAQAHCKVYNFCRRMLYWECARFHYIYILYQYCASCSTFQTVFMCACMYIYVPSVFLLSAVHNLVTITWDYTAFWWLHTAFQTQMYSVLFISLKILASVYLPVVLSKEEKNFKGRHNSKWILQAASPACSFILSNILFFEVLISIDAQRALKFNHYY